MVDQLPNLCGVLGLLPSIIVPELKGRGKEGRGERGGTGGGGGRQEERKRSGGRGKGGEGQEEGKWKGEGREEEGRRRQRPWCGW